MITVCNFYLNDIIEIILVTKKADKKILKMSFKNIKNI